MKHLREYNNWVSDVTDNVTVNYGDEKPKLSDIVVDAIKFIEDNYDKIDGRLNGTNESYIEFEHGLELESMRIDTEKNKNKNISYLHFFYRDINNDLSGYVYDITDYDYEYLKDYFYKIYRKFRKIRQEKDKEVYKLELQKIEDKKIKDLSKKMNI